MTWKEPSPMLAMTLFCPFRAWAYPSVAPTDQPIDPNCIWNSYLHFNTTSSWPTGLFVWGKLRSPGLNYLQSSHRNRAHTNSILTHLPADAEQASAVSHLQMRGCGCNARSHESDKTQTKLCCSCCWPLSLNTFLKHRDAAQQACWQYSGCLVRMHVY